MKFATYSPYKICHLLSLCVKQERNIFLFTPVILKLLSRTSCDRSRYLDLIPFNIKIKTEEAFYKWDYIVLMIL